MESSRTARKVIDTRSEGTRRLGRPKLRYEENWEAKTEM
jgi:hypothetical protein